MLEPLQVITVLSENGFVMPSKNCTVITLAAQLNKTKGLIGSLPYKDYHDSC